MINVNPKIIEWARVTAGLKVEEASKKMHFKNTKKMTAIEKLLAFESGEIKPSRSILSRMAKIYHRSLLVFYLSEPPVKGNRGEDYRTISHEKNIEKDAHLDILIRDLNARQSLLEAIIDEDEDLQKLTFVNSMSMKDGEDAVFDAILKLLKFDLIAYRKGSSQEKGFNYLRERIEKIGVFVLLISDLGSHHTSISTNIFRGIALTSDIAPFIVINEQDSKSAWSFTLIHEFVHICLGLSGISGKYGELIIEKFCDKIASRLLMPRHEIQSLRIKSNIDLNEIVEIISSFAKERNVSSSMVAYNLFLNNSINQDTWYKLKDRFYQFYLDNKSNKRNEMKKKDNGPSYFVVRKHRLGNFLINSVKQLLAEGSITTTKAGRVLGIKSNNVEPLINTAS